MASTFTLSEATMSRSSSRQGHGHGEVHSRSRSGTLNRSFKLDTNITPMTSNEHHEHHQHIDADLHEPQPSVSHASSHSHDHISHAHTRTDSGSRRQGRPSLPAPLLTSNGWKTDATPAGKPLVTPTNAVFAGQYKPPTATLSKPAVDLSAERSRFTNALLPYTAPWPLLHSVMTEKDSRRIFYFMSLNFAFMTVQAFYGYITDSLGLLSDSIHMFFDCVALAVGLFASVASKWPPNARFPYGFGKVETLSGFANGVFLILISVEIMIEACERILEGRETKRLAELFIVSSLGLIVNLVGMAAFGHHHHGPGHSHGCGGHSHDHGHDHGHSQSHSHSHIDSHTHSNGHASHSHDHDHDHDHDHKHSHDHSHKDDHNHGEGHDHSHSDSHSHSHNHEHTHEDAHQHSHHSHSHDNENMHGIYLHVLADTLGSGAVIVSTALTHFFPWAGWDPVASFLIAALILGSAIPLVRSSASGLLLTIPDRIEYSLRDILSGVTSLRGVVGYGVPRFWIDDRVTDGEASGDRLIGSIHILAVRGADLEDIRMRVQQYFSERKVDITLQIEREGDSNCWCGIGKSPLSPLSATSAMPSTPTISHRLKGR